MERRALGSAASRVWALTLGCGLAAFAAIPTVPGSNAAMAGPARFDAQASLGATDSWTLRNRGASAHRPHRRRWPAADHSEWGGAIADGAVPGRAL